MMGHQLVNVALARWAPHVTDRAFRVLVRMAATALDRPSGNQPAAVYFAGSELLAMTLRAERGGTSETILRTVRRAVSELISIGAIESLERGQKGQRAVYRLTLDADPKVEPTDSRVPLSGLQSPPIDPVLDSRVRIGGHQQSPLRGLLNTSRDELDEDEVVASPAVVQTARDDSAANDFLPVDVNRDRSAICSKCETYLDPDGSCFQCRRDGFRVIA